MGDTAVAFARRTLTLDTGRRKVDVPLDVLGRERWRSKLDEQRVTVRADDDEIPTAEFFGHAAVFNKRTWIGPKRWGFWEQVSDKAFDKTLPECDCRFLVNHDPNLLLARSRAGEGTLQLGKDKTGLTTHAPDLDRRQTYTNDVVISLEREDITQMSFAFEVLADEWELLDDETELRTINEVRLWDVSVVTYPAYEDTDAGLRAVAFDVLCRSAEITDEQRLKLLQDLTSLREIGAPSPPAEPESEPGSSTRETSQPGSSTGVPLALLKRRHELHARKHGLSV